MSLPLLDESLLLPCGHLRQTQGHSRLSQLCEVSCILPRTSCGHPCGAPCHRPPCPDTPCQQLIPITCACGLQKGTKACLKNNRSKKTKLLPCNNHCHTAKVIRQKLTSGLLLSNPDPTSDLTRKLKLSYSDFLKDWARRNPKFCRKISSKLTEIVKNVKMSEKNTILHYFKGKTLDEIYFIREYGKHFGCLTTVDVTNPSGNVAATAFKELSWIPSLSVLEIIEKEKGKGFTALRKIPRPVLLRENCCGEASTSVVLNFHGKI